MGNYAVKLAFSDGPTRASTPGKYLHELGEKQESELEELPRAPRAGGASRDPK